MTPEVAYQNCGCFSCTTRRNVGPCQAAEYHRKLEERIRETVQRVFDNHPGVEVQHRYYRLGELEQALVAAITFELLT